MCGCGVQQACCPSNSHSNGQLLGNFAGRDRGRIDIRVSQHRHYMHVKSVLRAGHPMGSAMYPDICAASQRRSHLLLSVPAGQGLAALWTPIDRRSSPDGIASAWGARSPRRCHSCRAEWAPRSRRGRDAPPARAATTRTRMWNAAATTQTSRCWVANSARCVRRPCVSVLPLGYSASHMWSDNT